MIDSRSRRSPLPRLAIAALVLAVGAGLVPAAEKKPAATAAATPPAPSGSPVADRGFTADDVKGLAWRSIGPANMGGRVSAIALIPGSLKSFYVGYAIGGVFKTENMGVTFTPVFDKYPAFSIGALAVADAPADWPGWADEKAPADANKDVADRGKGKIVWVGTGEGNGRNSSSWGGGVYRSTDAGATFKYLGLAETQDIPRIAVDPRNPDILYVAALGRLWGANPERGVYKTSDGGKSWQQILKVDDRVGACDVVLDPKSPDTVYAGLYARRRTAWSFSGLGEAGGIFRSDDAGKSFKKLTSGLPSRTGRIGLTVFPKDPRTLYAVVESDSGGNGLDDDHSRSGGLFRSDDRGETWRRVNDLNFRPFYFSRIAVDPNDEKRVYMPGWDLAISDDAGKTFRRSGSENVHVDFHAIVVNPVDSSQILVGNDGGIYLSHDRAATWDHLVNVAAGQFYRVAVDMSDPYRVAGGLQDNGSWMGPSQTLMLTEDSNRDGILNSDWEMVYGSDGFTVAFDPTDRNVVYATGQGADIARVRLDNKVMRQLQPSPREGQERYRFNWNAPFFVSPHDPSVLYLGGNKVFKLTQRGDLWAEISGDLSRNETDKKATVGSAAETHGTVVSLAESTLQKGWLWAGTDDGRVHVTEDDGKQWTEVTPAAVGGLYVSRIAPSRHDARTAYLAVDGHRSDNVKPLVLMTADLGKSWTDITGDLPAGGPVQVISEDLASRDVLYAGTEFGLYVTLTRGKAWVKLNGTSLPPAPVDDVVMHPREKDLVAATHGRSIYILDDASMFGQLTQEVRNRPVALLAPRDAKPRLYSFRDYGAGHAIFRAKNPAMGAAINYWLRDGVGESVSLTITDPSGAVIRKLDGPGYRGLNRVVWDLQADRKHLFKLSDENALGQTQFVPAGDYKISIKAGDATSETTVKVLEGPGAPKP
ncbi:MAG: glycosyl hydrolase [Acidobacteria bacterium]|nr:glycosyl hydrolase [Acidobacteriota bacterium]